MPADRFRRYCLLLALLCPSGLAVAWLGGCAQPAAQPTAAGPGSARSTADQPQRDFEFDDDAIETRLAEDVRYLAADEMQGRGPRTRGLELAADYLARRYAEIGLETRHYEGTPFHVFSTSVRLALGDGNRLAVQAPRSPRRELEHGSDFATLHLSSSGEFDLPVAFAGYGISAPDLGYDDYAGIDVRGKAVIVLRREPRQDDRDSPLNGTRNSSHAYLTAKVAAAAEHGAGLAVFCTDEHALAEAGRDGQPAPERFIRFNTRARAESRDLPVVHCRREVVDDLLSACGKPSLAELERAIDRDFQPRSFVLPGCRLSGKTSVTEKRTSLKNVIGVLPGRGPHAEETIVVGAHYDHLGMGGGGSLAPWTVAVHNGADDNASGTAGLLEIARQAAARQPENSRRVVFIAFSAEEMGLIGSERYVRSPLFPIEDTVAMVNLDMIGRLNNDRLIVYGTGTAEGFAEMIGRLGGKYGLRVTRRASGYGPSDHASFYARGVPVLHFFTGLHNDYHRPSDDFERINVPGMRRIAQMAADAVLELATAEQPLPPRTSRSADGAQPPPRTPQRQSAPGRTSLGLRVATREGGGIAILSVFRNSAAQRAQLRRGDVILRVEDKPINAPADLIDLVGKHKPGDRLQFLIRRGRTELQLDVELGG